MKKVCLIMITFSVMGLSICPELYSQKVHVTESASPAKAFNVGNFFTAAGWMGDGEAGSKYIQFFEGWREDPHSPPVCIKVVYTPGPKGWGGIFWQNKPDNWGDRPGEDFSEKGFKQISFWAKGENGTEIVEFKAGGISSKGKTYKDSFEVSTGKVYLEKDWKQYTIDLVGQNLSNVIGGFCWVASRSANPEGMTFYIDDILFE